MQVVSLALVLVTAFLAAPLAPAPDSEPERMPLWNAPDEPEIPYDHDACNDPFLPERRDDGSLVMAGAVGRGETDAWAITTDTPPHTLMISGDAVGGLVYDLMLHDGCEYGCRSWGEDPVPIPVETSFGGGCGGGVIDQWYLVIVPRAFADGYNEISYEAIWEPCTEPDGWCGPMATPAAVTP